MLLLLSTTARAYSNVVEVIAGTIGKLGGRGGGGNAGGGFWNDRAPSNAGVAVVLTALAGLALAAAVVYTTR